VSGSASQSTRDQREVRQMVAQMMHNRWRIRVLGKVSPVCWDARGCAILARLVPPTPPPLLPSSPPCEGAVITQSYVPIPMSPALVVGCGGPGQPIKNTPVVGVVSGSHAVPRPNHPSDITVNGGLLRPRVHRAHVVGSQFTHSQFPHTPSVAR
jgi:hypothetical protein